MPAEIMLSIIVVSYNTREMTLACLASVFETAGDVNFEILVVENASSDGSAEAIAAAYPDESRLRMTVLQENIGFARANNLAAETARGHFLLLLNPDTVVLPNALQALLAFAADRPQAKIWGGRTWFADMTLNATSCTGGQTLWSCFSMAFGLNSLFSRSEFFNPEYYGFWQCDRIREVDIVTGCFLLIETGFWRELEGFDPKFFMYAEEADLCIRARALGARPTVTPEASIIHHGGASEPARAPKMMRQFGAKVALMDKHWSAPASVLGRWLYLLRVLVRRVGYSVAARLSGKRSWATSAAEWKEIWRGRRVWLSGHSGG